MKYGVKCGQHVGLQLDEVGMVKVEAWLVVNGLDCVDGYEAVDGLRSNARG